MTILPQVRGAMVPLQWLGCFVVLLSSRTGFGIFSTDIEQGLLTKLLPSLEY
jgi:hypothetical protein